MSDGRFRTSKMGSMSIQFALGYTSQAPHPKRCQTTTTVCAGRGELAQDGIPSLGDVAETASELGLNSCGVVFTRGESHQKFFRSALRRLRGRTRQNVSDTDQERHCCVLSIQSSLSIYAYTSAVYRAHEV